MYNNSAVYEHLLENTVEAFKKADYYSISEKKFGIFKGEFNMME